MTIDRRRSPRIEVVGSLHGQIVALDLPIEVRNISLGGMTIQTTVRFPAGATHDFRLTLGDGSTTLLRGRVVHCDAAPGEEPADRADEPEYLAGIEFVDEAGQPGQPEEIGSLIARLNSRTPGA